MAFFWRALCFVLAGAALFLLPAFLFFHPLFLLFSLIALAGLIIWLFWFPEAPLERARVLPPQDPWRLDSILRELAEDGKRQTAARRSWISRLFLRPPVCLKAEGPAPLSLCPAPLLPGRAPQIIISETLLDILSEEERKHLLAWHFQALSSGGAFFLTVISRFLRLVQILLFLEETAVSPDRTERKAASSAKGLLEPALLDAGQRDSQTADSSGKGLRAMLFRLVLRGASLLTKPALLKLDQLAASSGGQTGGGRTEAGRQTAAAEEAGRQTAATEGAGRQTAAAEEAGRQTAAAEEAGRQTAAAEEAGRQTAAAEEAGRQTESPNGNRAWQLALLLWKLQSLSQTAQAPLPLFFAPLSPVCLLAGAGKWRSVHPSLRLRIKALIGRYPP